MSQMLIANRLQDGLTVFLAADGSWVTSIADGWLIDDDRARDHAVRRGESAERENAVIGPELIEVGVRDGVRQPATVRDAIRASGPSVRTDSGATQHVSV